MPGAGDPADIRLKELDFAVELVCRRLGVSTSAHYERRSGRRSARAVRDQQLVATIRRVHAANFETYGYRKMHLALRRAGIEDVGRDRVKRLMREYEIRGAKCRGKPWRTTTPDSDAARRPDLAEREFTATGPDPLYAADFTYLRCWEGLLFFAFVIDVFSRRVVGWQLATTCAPRWSAMPCGWPCAPAHRVRGPARGAEPATHPHHQDLKTAITASVEPSPTQSG